MQTMRRTTSGVMDFVKRTHTLRLLAYFLIAIVIRVVVYHKLPILLTGDAYDYLLATRAIFERLDFFTKGLGDVRLPGYPVFLAITWPLTKMQSNHIVVLQNMIGLASVLLGLFIGRSLKSRLLTEGLVLFLSINPVYLLFEHLLLTETLYIFSFLCFILVSILCLRWKTDWITGAILGFTLAISELIRTNGLPLYCILVAGMFIMKLWTTQPQSRVVALKKLMGFVFTAMLTAGAVFSPWILRNYRLYNTISLTNFDNRNLLIYKYMHGHLDNTLPKISAINGMIGTNQIDYKWLSKMSAILTTPEAEKISKDAFIEQIISHPIVQLKDMGESFACLMGMCNTQKGDRIALRYWFGDVINRESVISQLNGLTLTSVNPAFRYINTGIDVQFLKHWSQIGIYYLDFFRPVMNILFFVSMFIFIGYFDRKELTIQQNIILLLGIGYIAIIVAHTVVLADSDRLPIPFDIVAMMIILLVGSLIGHTKWRSWSTGKRLKRIDN